MFVFDKYIAQNDWGEYFGSMGKAHAVYFETNYDLCLRLMIHMKTTVLLSHLIL